jgi:hypothetical protein
MDWFKGKSTGQPHDKNMGKMENMVSGFNFHKAKSNQ